MASRLMQTQQTSLNRKRLNRRWRPAFVISLQAMPTIASPIAWHSAIVVLKTARLKGEGFYPIYGQ